MDANKKTTAINYDEVAVTGVKPAKQKRPAVTDAEIEAIEKSQKALSKLLDKQATIDALKETNIYQRMSRISYELQTVAKNLEINLFGRGKYRAVSEADVLRAVKPLEKKYRIFSYPFKRTALKQENIALSDKKTNVLFRVETVYRFVNIDRPDEFVDITSYGDGMDSGDKAPGKAMTYCDKYALLKAYKIVTGDDPDQAASEQIAGEIIDTALLQQLAELHINIEDVARFYKLPNATLLTNEQVKQAIQMKIRNLRNTGKWVDEQ